MHIHVIGDNEQLKECRQKLGSTHHYTHQQDYSARGLNSHCDILFSFRDDHKLFFLDSSHGSTRAFLNAAKFSLSGIAKSREGMNNLIFGFNGLPTFFNMPLLEVSALDERTRPILETTLNQLGIAFEIVKNQPGMVTPRVLSMIINEAYYTVQEGISSREDTDLAMKLGTNYPFGPFEWGRRIGIKHIIEVLTALGEETKDERHKICSLLREELLKEVGPTLR